MEEKEKEQLRLVAAALSHLEVRGEDNLSILLGCLQTLNAIVKGGDAA